jgi:EAL domain-containing protein (putative c-di-GMP-specific phosphodiesterase class I)
LGAERPRAIVEYAQRLGITVTAVGVETGARLDALQELGCDRVQGYLLCPPVAPARARELLDKGRPLLGALPAAAAEPDACADAG